MSDEGTRTGKTTINALQKAVSEAFIKYDQRRHYGHDTERAHREVQIAVFGLHQEISRYKFTNNLEEVWHEPISDSVEESLDDLTYFRFADRQRAEPQYNAVDAVWEDAAVNEPHVLGLRALQDISRQLDRCYHELGFDEVPKHVLSRRGTVGDSDPETRRSTAHVDVESLLVAEGLVAGPSDEAGPAELAGDQAGEPAGRRAGPADDHHREELVDRDGQDYAGALAGAQLGSLGL